MRVLVGASDFGGRRTGATPMALLSSAPRDRSSAARWSLGLMPTCRLDGGTECERLWQPTSDAMREVDRSDVGEMIGGTREAPIV